MINVLRYSLLVALLALGYGCSKDKASDEQAAGGGVAGDGAALLRYIPADTPYVGATLDPMPEDVIQALEPRIDKILRAYGEVLRSVVSDMQAKQGEDSVKSPEDRARIEAVLDELVSIMSVDGLKGMGFAINTTGVFYGQGLLPVARVRIADKAAMEAGIARFEEKAGRKMSVAQIDGQSYRYAGDEKARVLLALMGDELVVSLVPAQASDDTLKAVLGLSLPAKSLADTGELIQMAKSEGYLLNNVGLFDIRRIVDTFLEDQGGVNQELLALMDYDSSTLSDVCRTEIKAMANVMPRMNFGYTRMDKDRFDAKMVMEVRSDLAEGMKTLAAPVPGMGGDMGGMFGFGLSFDLLAAREFLSARVAALEAQPYECELFADLQNSAQAVKQALDQPLPPIVYSIKGFSMVLEDLEGFDFEKKSPPTGADLRGVLAVDNAQGLLAMGQMFSPELASLDLQPNGEVVELGGGIVPGLTDPIFLAMGDSAIAFSMGDGLEAKLPDMLAAKSPSDPPLMSMSYDAAAYMNLIGEAMKAGAKNKPDGEVTMESVSAVMDAVGGMMDRVSMDVILTERGIEIPYTMTMTMP